VYKIISKAKAIRVPPPGGVATQGFWDFRWTPRPANAPFGERANSPDLKSTAGAMSEGRLKMRQPASAAE
jgi:hypothetical protein